MDESQSADRRVGFTDSEAEPSPPDAFGLDERVQLGVWISQGDMWISERSPHHPVEALSPLGGDAGHPDRVSSAHDIGRDKGKVVISSHAEEVEDMCRIRQTVELVGERCLDEEQPITACDDTRRSAGQHFRLGEARMQSGQND